MYALLFQTFPTKMMIIVITAMNVLIQILSVIAKEDAFKKTAMMIMIVEKDIGKTIYKWINEKYEFFYILMV